MRFAFHGAVSDSLAPFAERLSAALEARGYERTDDLATANLVCNFVDRDNVRPYRRENKTTFCAAIYEGEAPPADFKEAISDYYPVLVRALSNVSVRVVPGVEARFGTMEQGNYAIADTGDDAFYANVAERLAPLAESHLVIDNIWNPDLEPELWDGDEVTESLTRSTSCLRRSRSRTTSTSATSTTSCGSTRSAASPTATCRPARMRPASG